MATIEIRHRHKTTAADARTRTRGLLALFAEEKKELVKSIDWVDDSNAVAHGRGFEGRFRVTDTEIVIDIDLNLLVRAFKAKVETRLRQRLVAEFGE
ncbi:MAG: polyhydroxyalkanoic acid system family protein [Deltaproteobacteria bacterium]|jgi:hypothetical protein|nr:polyhydroxyalkanoic acid system family protein [Deltaproteobacteria bacterium]